jgi:hypothetical protein
VQVAEYIKHHSVRNVGQFGITSCVEMASSAAEVFKYSLLHLTINVLLPHDHVETIVVGSNNI